jgi:hypothetical protein
MRLQCILGGLSVISALPVPFTETFTIFAIEIWLVLFFGGAILPQVTGIMLNSVPESKRTSANSIANLCYNLLGYMPASAFYGLVSSVVKTIKGYDDEESKIPLGCLLYTTLFTISLLFYGIYLRLKGHELKQDGVIMGETGSSVKLSKMEKPLLLDQSSSELKEISFDSYGKIKRDEDSDSLLEQSPNLSVNQRAFNGEFKKPLSSRNKQKSNAPGVYSMSPA